MDEPGSRLLTVILMRCGLRVGDATKIAFDCVVRDGDGAPYLRYVNRKMKREALVPIDEEVEQAITGQQQRILASWPDGSPWLFPAPKMNPDGRKHLSTHSYRGQLRDWLDRCEVRDEHGRPGPPDPPPMAPYLRHQADQQGRAPGSGTSPARSFQR